VKKGIGLGATFAFSHVAEVARVEIETGAQSGYGMTDD
jgi:hypothetical protein